MDTIFPYTLYKVDRRDTLVTNTLIPYTIFPTTIYSINKKEFLEKTLRVTNDFLREAKNEDEAYPVLQTSMMIHPDLEDIQNFVAQSSWTILNSQGFEMSNKATVLTDCWGQQFSRGGNHVEHIHSYGSQVSAFYFLEVPENSSMMAFYDPRHTKRQINLHEKDNTKITDAAEGVLYKINEGDVYFANAWLPHGFTAHASDQPLKFIHFNIAVQNAPQQPAAEVV
jgi:uncharacterized protein (TIGR02466 family)